MSLVELTRVGSVAVVELCNGKVNALSNGLLAELAATLSSLASLNDVGAIVIRGSNKAFSGVSRIFERYI
jgi:enoyl-CoA hydratase/carnithine racemase